jgi:electron transport complex protein RnfC
MDCIECGCCAFVCPAKVNLIQRIRLGKGLVRQKMAEEKAKAAAKAAAEKAASEGGK